MSSRFPSSVIDQMLTRGQITRVAPNRAQSDQLLTQAEAHLRSARMLQDTDAGTVVSTRWQARTGDVDKRRTWSLAIQHRPQPQPFRVGSVRWT